MYYFLDKLTKNLVNDAIEWDKKDNLHKAPLQRSDHHLQGLVRCISSCGVSFNVWEKVDADEKGSGLYDFTSLIMVLDKKLLLKNLPEKLTGVSRSETSENSHSNLEGILFNLLVAHLDHSFCHFIYSKNIPFL